MSRHAGATTLVVADLDGTLTFTGRAPEPEVLAAWDAVMACPGVRVALATARSPRCVQQWFGQRLAQTDLICCNGALVVPRTGQVSLRPLPATAVRQVVHRLAAEGTGYALEYGDHFAASDPDVLPWMGRLHRRAIPPGTAPQLEGVVKLCVATSAAAHRATAGLRGVSVLPHSTGDADVMAAGVGKEVAAASLRRQGQQLVVLGNDENDRGLLWAADSAYLVGSGLRDLDVVSHLRRVPADPATVAGVLSGLSKRLRGGRGLTVPPAWRGVPGA